MRSYKDLNIWKRSIELVNDIYKLSCSFTKEELYILTSQIRRTAISIPSNIAEGFARFHNKEYRQFLYISLGSCAELETQIIIANNLKYLEDDELSDIINRLEIIGKMISNLIKKINNCEKVLY
ncbi:MAG: four helix bundle protein [Atribacterota bacterium]|nr:four helix bundle protein [Atribacterota bacterium]MDD4895486.1 four helix bundle protein [Atribacterota bacterium]MDD5637861.1 four helix bundle protein [Atribacterota bacterium]